MIYLVLPLLPPYSTMFLQILVPPQQLQQFLQQLLQLHQLQLQLLQPSHQVCLELLDV